MKFNIRKGISAFLLISGMVCTLCACQSAEHGKETADTALPELKIGDSRIRPFFYKDENGDYTGIDVEIAQEACKRAGYQPVFVEIPSGEKEQYLKNGAVDCLWAAYAPEDLTDDGEQWTQAYRESNIGILVGQNSPDDRLENLKSNGGIAVVAGSKAEEMLLQRIHKSAGEKQNVYSCGSFEQAETAFIKGYAGALVGDEIVLKQIMQEYPDSYRMLDEKLKTIQLSAVFGKDTDPVCWQEINKAIGEMKQEGAVSEIIRKYDPDEADAKEVGSGEQG